MYYGGFKMIKWKIIKLKYVVFCNFLKVIKKKNKEMVIILFEYKFCFIGCGEGEKVNDKVFNVEYVKLNKGV